MNVLNRLLLPENLIYAWRKAKRLYRMADGYIDRAEVYAFELNLEDELALIQKQFEKGIYKTKKLRPLPRPKKLNKNGEPIDRQYYHIAVQDQVAWIAVVNALGPEIDKMMPSWSYGNRLYRPAWYEEDNEAASKLEIGPYRHANGHLYRKFQHSWPLFRRHVALSAKNMTRPIKREDLERADQLALASANTEKLPYLNNKFWRRKSKISDLYYASIDLKQFYPSIKSQAIRNAFAEVLPELAEEEDMGGLLKSMCNFSLDLTDMPKNALEIVEPPFGRQTVQGIPTGLFVAGFLANVAMLPVDRKVHERLDRDRTVAHFRFVDDHTLIAYDFDTLCDWIDWYIDLLADMDIGPEVNVTKYDPPSLGDWMSNTMKKNQETGDEADQQKNEAKLDCQIDGRNPTKLLTKTLGQVSDIANTNADILDDQDIEDRLKYLEWLLLADIPDRELRADTRAAFAAGQIATLAPILIQETNGLVDEVRVLAELKRNKPDLKDEEATAVYVAKVDEQNQHIENAHSEHEENEKKYFRHYFQLLLQAFSEHPSKARLYYRLIQYCRLTGHDGLREIAEWIQDINSRNHVSWADYYSGLTLHILADNLLRSIRTLADTESMWSDRKAALRHIVDITNMKARYFFVPLERQAWFHKTAMHEFATSMISAAEWLQSEGYEQRLINRLKVFAEVYSSISFQASSDNWMLVTGRQPGVWAHLTESVLEAGSNPSPIWGKFEACFDYNDPFDRNAARRYPEILSDRGWASFIGKDRILKKTDSGWIYEVISRVAGRKREAHNSKKIVFKRAARAYDACPESHIRVSEWTRFVKQECCAFDPRQSEWTALEIMRLIIKPAFSIGQSKAYLDNLHPVNILIPRSWSTSYKPTGNGSPMSWETWRTFVEKNDDVHFIRQGKMISDYRYSTSEKSLTGAAGEWEKQLHGVGRLLLGLLRNEHSMPRIWNIRGNEYTTPFPSSLIFSKLAISSLTLLILESCLSGRSIENRTICHQPLLFGWSEGEETNDTQLDPPLLSTPNDLYDYIEKAQKNLVCHQISVSMDQPRQLIPVKLEGLTVTDIEDGANDGK